MEVDGNYGFIDTRGNTIIPFKYEFVKHKYSNKNFSEGLAIFEKNGKLGYLNREGNEVIPATYDGADLFSEGFAGVVLDYVDSGFIDKSGNIQIPFIYSETRSFSNGIAQVFDWNEKTGYINKQGVEYWED